MWKKAVGAILNITINHTLMTSSSIARSIHVEGSTVRHWKRGTHCPGSESLEKLCAFLQEMPSADSSVVSESLKTDIKNYLTDINLSGTMEYLDCLKGMEYATAVLKECYKKSKYSNATNNGINGEKYPTSGRTKAVVFDFDGTLTVGATTRTTWEMIWEHLGYSVDDCRKYHYKYNNREISHQEWCLITQEHFIKKGLHREYIDIFSDSVRLISGVASVFTFLQQNYIKIYIVSGSIRQVIQRSLGLLCSYVEDIAANSFNYNQHGVLESISGTKYDFEGKADYINNILVDLKASPCDVLFVGNSLNDEYVHLTGVQTLCINPKKTNPYNNTIWTDSIEECSNLRDILPYIRV